MSTKNIIISTVLIVLIFISCFFPILSWVVGTVLVLAAILLNSPEIKSPWVWYLLVLCLSLNAAVHIFDEKGDRRHKAVTELQGPVGPNEIQTPELSDH